MPAKKLMVIGLDCAAPELVFEQFAGKLPHLDSFRRQARWGRLESVTPPITVPAWACMMSGKDPGQLGIYGFRNRSGYGYDQVTTANSESIREPLLWDILGSIGLKSILLSVPPSYPVKPVRGVRVGCFLTPSTDGDDWASPKSVVTLLNEKIGGYSVDVKNFRSDDKDRLLKEIFELNHRQFDAAEALLKHEPWDYFMMVNIAVDRMHHAFWASFDPEHRRYMPGNPYEDKMLAFYQEVDARIGRLLELADQDTAVLIVSDHGAKRIDGGICINEWMIANGYLTLAGPKPSTPKRYDQVGVDWSQTKAWGEGGYYARIFVNRAGREPHGTVADADYEAFLQELTAGLKAIPDDQGNPIATHVFRPSEIYPKVNGIAPDLLVHFGDLHWRSIGTVGYDSIHTLENDTGPDDANHAQHGIYLLRGKDIPAEHADGKLLQIAPTLLKVLGKRIPRDMTYPPMV